MNAPPVPSHIAAAIADYPDTLSALLLELRGLIFDTAALTPRVGTVTETLKWGQPAYLTASGTTVRLAAARGGANAVGVYTSCQTPLVTDFAVEHGDLFEYDGVRGVHVAPDGPLHRAELSDFIAAALTYKLR